MTASWFLVALRHDRAVILGSLAFVVLLAWSYLLLGAGVGPEMMDMGAGQMMAMPPEWSLGYGLVIFVMWAVMMLAMMLPSAAPVTLLIASLNRKRATAGGAVQASTALFVFGYLAVWLAFAAAATTLQWALDEAGLLSETMAFGNIVIAASVLVAAGVYQWTPLKGGVSATLPLAARLPSLPLARRRPRRGGERRRARLFLPRLLLDADGAPVRRRDHEPRLDRRHRAVGSDREDPALGQADQPIDGCRARRLGCRHPSRCGLTMSHNKKHGGDTVDRSWVRSPLPRNIIFIRAAPSSCMCAASPCPPVARVSVDHGLNYAIRFYK